jgi:hypothetical protein
VSYVPKSPKSSRHTVTRLHQMPDTRYTQRACPYLLQSSVSTWSHSTGNLHVQQQQQQTERRIRRVLDHGGHCITDQLKPERIMRNVLYVRVYGLSKEEGGGKV